MKPKKVFLAASEGVPFCKTGGLGDVVGALWANLNKCVPETGLFLPYYRAIDKKNIDPKKIGQIAVELGANKWPVNVIHARHESGDVYFIDHPCFDREGLYGEAGKDYPDNDERFIIFNRAVIEALRVLHMRPDVIHCHDWMTGLIPAYLKTIYRDDPFFSGTRTLMTIHNMAYQGRFPQETMGKTGIAPEEFTMDKFEFYGQFNFLKAGLVYSDLINTVSPAYAREIQTDPQKGCALEGVLKNRQKDLFGVLNGIDTDLWNPATDRFLAQSFDFDAGIKTLRRNKSICKEYLQKNMGLPQVPGKLFLGMVSRLDPQKGINLVINELPGFLKSNKCQVVLLGVGSPDYQDALEKISREFPDQFKAVFSFDDALARQIYAGSDCLIMPSIYEPCGLSQMIAMRYGSLPIVTKTGGLADTVNQKNGFLMNGFLGADLTEAIHRAIKIYGKPAAWEKLMTNALKCDFGWERSIKEYLKLYSKAKARPR